MAGDVWQAARKRLRAVLVQWHQARMLDIPSDPAREHAYRKALLQLEIPAQTFQESTPSPAVATAVLLKFQYVAAVPHQPPAPYPESLSGLIERVTFHNEDTGLAVLKVKAKPAVR